MSWGSATNFTRLIKAEKSAAITRPEHQNRALSPDAAYKADKHHGPEARRKGRSLHKCRVKPQQNPQNRAESCAGRNAQCVRGCKGIGKKRLKARSRGRKPRARRHRENDAGESYVHNHRINCFIGSRPLRHPGFQRRKNVSDGHGKAAAGKRHAGPCNERRPKTRGCRPPGEPPARKK